MKVLTKDGNKLALDFLMKDAKLFLSQKGMGNERIGVLSLRTLDYRTYV